MEQYQMSDYRIVYNEQTDLYRVERRGWAGWSFVMDKTVGDYATFRSCQAAKRFICRRQRGRPASSRRWQVVDGCRRPCPTD